MLHCIIFCHTVSDWTSQYKTYYENLDETHKTNHIEKVLRWPRKNFLKGDKSSELPGLVDEHGRGHMVAIIKPVKRIVNTIKPDKNFESEEGDFSD